MKRFLRKASIFLFLFFGIVIALLSIIDCIGWTDSAYLRFTSKGQQSLIIGTSRAAQGIVPSIINDFDFGGSYRLPIYNFSFNVGESPYGEVYYNAIKRKVGVNPNHDSVFILAVDPFSLSNEINQDCNREREKGGRLDWIKHYYRPQIFYLLKYCRPWRWANSSHETLHDDGWLEIHGIPMDSLSCSNRLRLKMEEYNSMIIIPSSERMSWLVKCITYLKQYGKVYLCRIPVSEEMLSWEDINWPSFDAVIDSVAIITDVDYINFRNHSGNFRTTDGNHLYFKESEAFTMMLCDSLSLY